MQSQLYDEVFEEFFSDKIQIYKDKVQRYKDEIAVAQNEVAAVQAKFAVAQNEVAAVQAKFAVAQNEIAEVKARSQEAEARAEIVEELFYSTMYETICDALSDRGKVENVPSDVLDKLEQIKSYSILRQLLSVAKSRQSDYEAFLAALDEGERQEKNATL